MTYERIIRAASQDRLCKLRRKKSLEAKRTSPSASRASRRRLATELKESHDSSANNAGCESLSGTYFHAPREYETRVRYRWLRVPASTDSSLPEAGAA